MRKTERQFQRKARIKTKNTRKSIRTKKDKES